MAINERLIHTAAEAAGGGTGNQGEEGLILHLDANDVDSYDGDGSVWYDITNYEYTPAEDPSEHFNTVLYTGNNSSHSIDCGFQPDLVWIKNRTYAISAYIHDSIRGANSAIGTATTAAAVDFGNGGVSMDSDGFTIGGESSTLNNTSFNYVAWCFKAGGAPSGSDKVSIDGTSYATMTAAGLTDGTEAIDKLSVNTKLGFSIVKYTAPALAVDTVAHGLGETPEMIILKSTSVDRNWNVYHKDVGTSKNIHLNRNDEANTSEYWTVNANTFSIQDYSASADWIAYCFTSKRGVSKVSSYTGTGAAGNKVYTGFQPAFVLFKESGASGQSWNICDNARGAGKRLYADLTSTENTTSIMDFNGDGFTFTGGGNGYNGSGKSYIYLAFAAENSTSLIDDTDLELHLDPASYSGSGTTWTADTGSDATVVASRYDEELGDSFDISLDSESTITIPSGHPLNDNSFTLEFWFRSTENWNNSGKGHYFIYEGSAEGWNFFYYEGLGWRLSTPVSTGYFGNGTVKTNVWHHVSLTYTGGTTKFYLDGELLKTHSETRSNSSLGSFDFGSTEAATYKPKCLVGQIRMYSAALTADEVMQNYRFTKNDYPNGKHATLTSATWAPEGSFSFQNGQYATIPVGDFVGDNNKIRTITSWVKADTTTSRVFPYTISSSSNGNRYFTIGMYNDNNKVYCSCRNGGSTSQFQDQFTITPDTDWHHLAVTFDGTTRRLYFDGNLQTTTEDNRGSATSSDWITYANIGSSPRAYIGRGRQVNSWYSDGKVSDVKFFDRALTDDEIEADYNKGQFGNN